MSHNSKCSSANPKTPCHCTCGGRLHGSSHPEPSINARSVNSNLGGDLGSFITSYIGKSYVCLGSCGCKHEIVSFLAYPHASGLSDSSGQKWHLFVECPQCGYQLSFHKLPRRIQHQSQFSFQEGVQK